MRRLVQFSAATVILAIAQISFAEEIVDATSPKKLMAIIQDMGYRAKLDTDNVGDPVIESSVGGTDFFIQFFGCTSDRNDRCTLILFKVGYDMTDGTSLRHINEWNTNALVGRVYLDDEDDPWLEWAVNLDKGVSRKNFEESFNRWEIAVGEFEDHIDF